MDFFDVIKARRSIRAYQQTAVRAETLATVLDAARLAPSWHNTQCWQFLIVSDNEKKRLISAAVPDSNPGKKGLQQAPLIILACGCPDQSGDRDGKPYYLIDVGISVQHLCLAAQAVGLGTCWIGAFDEQALKQEFEIPESFRIVALTPLGYPAQERHPRPRKALSEIVFFEKWGLQGPDPEKE